MEVFSGTNSFPLMAVPLFMYAGAITEEGGISRRRIDFANALVGWLPGGLAAVTIVASMFFAGISGSAAVGAVLIPAMKNSGYESDFSAAVQASGGSLGVIIPPSIPMIIFGFLTGASIGRLFAAGILPGLLVGISLIGVATVISRKRGYAPDTAFSAIRVWQTFKGALMALGAPIIMFITATAPIFSWIAAMEDLPDKLAGSLLSITTHPAGLLLLINGLLLDLLMIAFFPPLTMWMVGLAVK